MPDSRKLYSVEFYPPRTPEGVAKLRAARAQLAQLKPAFFSVTFGAGGSTREGTLETVLEIRGEGLPAAPHISCIGAPREALRDVLAQYRAHGIRHLVALRGDLPSGSADAGEFRYASELVAFIREETGDWFHIDVAAYPEYHPQARSADEDLANFERKVKAGADSAITQYFFNADAYWHFVDACAARGVTVPIVAGHHADPERQRPGALLRQLRRGNSALDTAQARKLRRRPCVGARVRPRRRHGALRGPDRRRRAGAAFLHAQFRGAHDDHLAAAGAVGGPRASGVESAAWPTRPISLRTSSS